jgi:molecular chaperone HtpG
MSSLLGKNVELREQQEFLRPDIDEIRHQISQIIESYNHDWDVLAELAQNSVDAIRAANVPKGHVSLLVDAANGRIVIEDNGVGFPSAEISRLLRPFGTSKKGNPKAVGMKGVGLKFVIFSSREFELSSNDGTKSTAIAISNAHGWLNSNVAESLQLSVFDAPERSRGTSLALQMDPSHPIFSLSTDQLRFVLFTRTAFGDTATIFGEAASIDIALTHVSKGGEQATTEQECAYLLPIAFAQRSDTVDLEEYEAWRIETDPSDTLKRNKLNGRIVVTTGVENVAGRKIRYWACTTPKRDTWRKLSENARLANSAQAEDDFLEADLRFKGEIQTATKGMPTGISLVPKAGGSAGYLANFFIVIDDPALVFDIGRKSIQSRQQGLLRELAAKVFRKYVTLRKFMGSEIQPTVADFDKDQLFGEIEELPNMTTAISRFRKRPNAQEAMVAALFYEQLGRNNFDELTPLISGYKEKYDLYALWGKKRVTIEFKFDVSGLLYDFSDAVKMLNEINCLVVWEVTEKDRILLAKNGINLSEIGSSSISDAKSFPGATSYLFVENVTPTFVVEMKRILSPA